MPPDLHEQIAAMAAQSGRSVNAEIVYLLQRAVMIEAPERDPQFREAIREELMTFLHERPELAERWSGVQVRSPGEPIRPINQVPDDEGAS